MNRIKRQAGLIVALVFVLALLVAIPVLAQAVNADLAVAKTVDNATPFNEATIRYTIVATNNGPDEATGVAVTDLLPAGVTYVADSGGGVFSGTTGLWTIGSLAVGSAATLDITVTVGAGDGTVITNTAAITGVVTDINLANNSAAAVLTVVNQADLAVTEEVDNPTPSSGDTIRYTLTVVNNGPNAATGVAVTDLLPAGVTYVADSGGGAYSSTTGIWSIGPLVAGTPASLIITGTVGAAGSTIITNTAAIGGTEVDPNPANNSASASLTIAAAPPLVTAPQQQPSTLFLPLVMRAFAPPPGTTLPLTTCTLNGAIRTCNLWARSGSLTMPDGAVVTIWGYAVTATGAATVPGPMLIVNEGETVVVNLHNDLAEATALLIDEQAMLPDLVGAAPATTKSYTFTASAPGTYLYEAGLLPNAQHQVAMGLYGAFIVRPATPSQAYDDPATAFFDEALLVLGEIDPALNNSADPATFDMRNYAPRYWLINGLAYPDSEFVIGTAGNTVLLRYVNAGLQHHSMALLGLSQTVIGLDGSPLAYPYRIVAESLAPGQTADVLVAVPASTAAGTRFALYDGNVLLNNNGAAGFGGMLTFLAVGFTPPPGPDIIGPATTAVTLSPNPTNGQVDVALSASVSDVASGNANVTRAEYFIDTPGANGSGTTMGGAFGSPTVAVNATIAEATLGALSAGNHLVYVHGQDSLGNWGSFNFGVLQVVTGGPVARGLILWPNPSNGNVSVALRATGDGTASGNGNITAAEYFIDAPGADGTGVTMLVNFLAPIASLDAVILTPTLTALAEGAHPVYVHAQDEQLNWGPFATIDLLQDRSGPATSGVSAAPNPNNGTQGVNSNVPAVRVMATFDDRATGPVTSNINTAEGFIDTAGADGTGFPFIAVDSLFNSPTEVAYADIPLATIALLTDGSHSIYVHSKDAAGNWGGLDMVSLWVDKTGPAVTDVVATPNPTLGAANVTLTANATDVPANVAAAEWFVDLDPGIGFGTPMSGAFGSPNVVLSATIDVSSWPLGPHTIAVRARDAAGNWGTAASTVLDVGLANNILTDGFESGNFSAWSSTGGTPGRISATLGSTQAGTYKMEAQVAQNTSGYVQDNTPAAETSYHARLYFNPNNMTINTTPRTIFSGLDAATQTVFQVQVRFSGGNYQASAMASHAGGMAATNWFNISNNAYTAIEIAWISGNPASFSLYTGGTLQQTLTGLDTSAFTLDAALLGPQGVLNGLNGTIWYFDSFVSTRYTVIGS